MQAKPEHTLLAPELKPAVPLTVTAEPKPTPTVELTVDLVAEGEGAVAAGDHLVAAGEGEVVHVGVVPVRLGGGDAPEAKRAAAGVPFEPRAGAGGRDLGGAAGRVAHVAGEAVGHEGAGAVHAEALAQRRAGAQLEQHARLGMGGGAEREHGRARGEQGPNTVGVHRFSVLEG